MSLKLDKFTWSIVTIVALLLIGAVITVNMTGGEGYGEPDYLAENSPEAAVYNAFVAGIKNDNDAVQIYYTQRVLDQYRRDGQEGGQAMAMPYSGPGYYRDTSSRRLRILDVKQISDERADVTFVVDTYSAGGPFGSGNTWSNEQVLPVELEDGTWKVDTSWFYF